MNRVWVDRVPRFAGWRWGLYSFHATWRICLGPAEIVIVKK